MHIAILGAGFSGLAAAWHLLNASNGRCHVTLFDPAGIGGGASGISVGLVHPYSGAHAKLNWRGQEGWLATQYLLRVAADALHEPVADFSGILRLATTEEQRQDFALCAAKYPHDVEWKSAAQCQKLAPATVATEGIWIHPGAVVDAVKYMEGLWLACQRSGAIYVDQAVVSLHSVAEHFDAVIVAMGTATTTLPELNTLPLTVVKGQVLELEWPKGVPPLSCAINSHAYLIMHPNKKSCFAGATYERGYESAGTDPARALSELGPKIAALVPGLEQARILSCRAGLRSVTADHRPLKKHLFGNCWVLSGMGSKGLLYHALFARELSEAVLAKGQRT